MVLSAEQWLKFYSDVLQDFVYTSVGLVFCVLYGFPRFPFLFSGSHNPIWFKVDGHRLYISIAIYQLCV